MNRTAVPGIGCAFHAPRRLVECAFRAADPNVRHALAGPAADGWVCACPADQCGTHAAYAELL
jgi:hypothetical protein